MSDSNVFKMGRIFTISPVLFGMAIALSSPAANADATQGSEGNGSADHQQNITESSNSLPTSPYATPWQLRSIVPGNTARLDSALAFYDDKNGHSGGFAAASDIGGSYKLSDNLALLARIDVVNNAPPANAAGETVFTNPLLGATYSLQLSSEFRLGFFLGMTVPIGSGSGNTPNPAVTNALNAGILARSAMDNALFATNYFGVIPGLDLAYIANGWTVQLEATLLQFTRVKSDLGDQYRTNFTSGFELGYSFTSLLMLEGELHYQRYFNNQTVEATANPAIQNLAFTVGPRFTFKAGDFTLKPGIAYAQGLSGAIAGSGYTYAYNSDKIIFVDFPVSF
jgi:hypothetical protein